MSIRRATAEKIWDQIRTDLVNVEKNIIRAIETRSWEPLGYDSFAACWNDRLKGLRIATDLMKVHVVYALLDTTSDPIGVLGVGSGVAPSAVGRIKSLKDAGMSVEEAVASGIRKPWGVSSPTPATKPVVIRGLDLDVFEQYRSLAAEFGSTVEDEATKALHRHFRELARKAEKKSAA